LFRLMEAMATRPERQPNHQTPKPKHQRSSKSQAPIALRRATKDESMRKGIKGHETGRARSSTTSW
jgi:hypothetical protein